MAHRHAQLHELGETLSELRCGFRSCTACQPRPLTFFSHQCDPILLGGFYILSSLLRHIGW